MKKRIIIIVVIVAVIAGITTLVGLSILGIRKAQEDALGILTEEAVVSIAGEMVALCHETSNPTSAEIDARIDLLRTVSAAIMAVDAHGKTVDLYGTPFKMTHLVSGKAHIVTAVSAGPDRVFNTADDISRTRSWDYTGAEKK